MKKYLVAVMLAQAIALSVSSEPIPADVSVSVIRTSGGNRVNSSFAGFSYEKGYLALGTFDATNTAQVNLFKRLGPGILRIGANHADETAWDAAGKGLSFPQIAPSDVDRLADFLRACNWRVIYAVRFVNNTPEQAAAESAYVAKALGDRLLAFEIGNEPDHYCYLANEVYHRHFIGPVDTQGGRFRPKNYGCKDFYQEWTAFADAITNVVPKASFVGPSCGGGGVDKTGKDQGWAKTFAELGGRRLAFLTTHYYIGGPQDAQLTTSEYMLHFPETRLANVLGRLKEWSRASGIHGGFLLDEANSYYGGGKGGLSDTFASALWTIKFLFVCAQNDACRGVNLHSRGHVPYTPIAFKLADSAMAGEDAKIPGMATTIEDIRPEYYGLSLFDLAVGGKIQTAEITGTNPDGTLSAYAVAADDGSTHVVLVNTSVATAFRAAVNFTAPTQVANLVRLTGTSLSATDGTLLNGAVIGPDGKWDPHNEAPLPTPNGKLVVSVAPFSAVLLMAH